MNRRRSARRLRKIRPSDVRRPSRDRKLLSLLQDDASMPLQDIAGYDRVYKQLIAKVPGLSDVSALFSMERIKYTTKLEPPV
jgi:DNA-binding Lrp family transcriptional regulator